MVVDHTLPEGRWTFDADVTGVFDDMLERSIPQYHDMRALVTWLAHRFRQPDTAIVDLGASRGEAIAPLVRQYGALNRFIAVEVAAPMIEVMRERYGKLVDVMDIDLRTDYPKAYASVTLAILTLQFIPIEHRQRVVDNAYQFTTKGGALIVVEKVLGRAGGFSQAMIERYLAMKAEHGYSQEEIERKRLSLEGVLVPQTEQANAMMLHEAGFRAESFWRWMNFMGWIALKV